MSKFDLAYESGIALMKELNADIKTIGELSKWPLGVLIAIVAALVSVIFGSSDLFADKNREAIGLLFVCSITILAILLTITTRCFGLLAHNEPENLIKGSPDSVIKNEVTRLQGQVNQNKSRFKELKNRLIFSIIFVFSVLAVAFTWFFLI